MQRLIELRWALGDILYASPVVLGPPAEELRHAGDGREVFEERVPQDLRRAVKHLSDLHRVVDVRYDAQALIFHQLHDRGGPEQRGVALLVSEPQLNGGLPARPGKACKLGICEPEAGLDAAAPVCRRQLAPLCAAPRAHHTRLQEPPPVLRVHLQTPEHEPRPLFIQPQRIGIAVQIVNAKQPLKQQFPAEVKQDPVAPFVAPVQLCVDGHAPPVLVPVRAHPVSHEPQPLGERALGDLRVLHVRVIPAAVREEIAPAAVLLQGQRGHDLPQGLQPLCVQPLGSGDDDAGQRFSAIAYEQLGGRRAAVLQRVPGRCQGGVGCNT
mmetsp:Transcript_15515/g.48267  ORF Transcript_15515/g.48267 Transcript_15515/m.48267 type:complete len:325 (-) Transcript_15515:109-1083(-)